MTAVDIMGAVSPSAQGLDKIQHRSAGGRPTLWETTAAVGLGPRWGREQQKALGLVRGLLKLHSIRDFLKVDLYVEYGI